MMQALDKLNLRPQEKRLVVIGGVILFAVLNLWFVWPHFSEAGRIKKEIETTSISIAKFQAELAHTNEYQTQLDQLRSAGADILAQDRSSSLMSTVQNYILQTGINSGGLNLVAARGSQANPNPFFDERTLSLTLNPTGPEELVKFLVTVAGSDLVIRVKELSLRPDPSQSKLAGNMKLVASFQKKTAAPGPAATPKS